MKTTNATESTKATRTRKPKTAPTAVETQVRNEAHVAEDTMAEQATTVQTEAAIAASTPAKAEKAPKVLPTLDEALAAAKLANPRRYTHVLRVTELTKDGDPKRVVVECSDPQTKQGTDGQPVSVCEGEREIAVQDLFQVECCAACADRKVRKARRERAKRKNKALRQALKAAKQG